MNVTEQKFSNLLPRFGKIPKCEQQWKMEHTSFKKIRKLKKTFFSKIK